MSQNINGPITGGGHIFIGGDVYMGAEKIGIKPESISQIAAAIKDIAGANLQDDQKKEAISLLQTALGATASGRGDKASISGQVKKAAEVVENAEKIATGADKLLGGLSVLAGSLSTIAGNILR